MAAYNPLIHNRKSIRLKGYDYSKAGLYFITICCQDMTCLFGEIINGEMILNDAGKMVETWYNELENKYPDKRCHEMVVMPNHFHCIIENVDIKTLNIEMDNINGMDAHGMDAHGMDAHGMDAHGMDAHVGAPLRGHTNTEYGINNKQYQTPLGNVIGWFKTMTTNQYIRGVKTLKWQPFNGKLWQRNYYEHIIRNDNSYERISNYIINNPKKWSDDKFHAKSK